MKCLSERIIKIAQTATLLLFVLSFFLSGEKAFASVQTGYGYVSLFGEIVGSASGCSAEEAMFDFETKEFNTENAVTPTSITVSVIDGDGATVRTAQITGGSRTNTVCVDLTLYKLQVRVDGGIGYKGFNGSYGVPDGLTWAGKYIRSHIHLVPSSSIVPTVRTINIDGPWFNSQPQHVVEVGDIPPVHGASAVHSIMLYSGTTQTASNILVPCCTGTGSYTLTYPELLPEGWHTWGAYVGLNGGSPDPMSAYSGNTGSFGIDQTAPNTVVTGTYPQKASFLSSETYAVVATSTDTLSGIESIQILHNGTEIKKCTFSTPGSDAPKTQTCVSDAVGPFSITQIFEVVTRDTVGNVATTSVQVPITCTVETAYGMSGNQFKGCLKDMDTNEMYGDAPGGTVVDEPLVSPATLIDFTLNLSTSSILYKKKFYTSYYATLTLDAGYYEITDKPGQWDYTLIYIATSSASGYKCIKCGASYAATTTTGFVVGTSGQVNIAIYYWHNSTDATQVPKLTATLRNEVCNPYVRATNHFSGCVYSDTGFDTNFGVAPDGPFVATGSATTTALDFDWGAGTPVVGLPANNFSARWTGEFDFTPGWYSFFIRHDDTLSAYFSSKNANSVYCNSGTDLPRVLRVLPQEASMTSLDRVYNVGGLQSTQNRGVYCEVLSTTTITMQLNFIEFTGNSYVRFGWTQLGGPVTYCDTAYTEENTLVGCLYKGTDYRNLGFQGALPNGIDVTDSGNSPQVLASQSATTTAISMSWGSSSPDPYFVGSGYWSGVWKAKYHFPAGTYTFVVSSYPWSIFSVGNISSGWVYNATSTVSVTFPQATTTTVVLDFYNNATSNARIYFGWKLQLPTYTVNTVPVGVFPGIVPSSPGISGTDIPWWLSSKTADNSSTTTSPVAGVTGITLQGIDMYNEHNPGGIVEIQVKNTIGGLWETVWSKFVTTTKNYISGLGIRFSSRSISGIKLTTTPVVGTYGWNNMLGSRFNLGFSVVPGFGVSVNSIGGFADTMVADVVPPAGVIKTGAWPKTCTVSAFGTCSMGMELHVDDSLYPFRDYPITINVSDQTPPLDQKNITTVLKVWGFDVAFARNMRSVGLDEMTQFQFGSQSRNEWAGANKITYELIPNEPTITVNPSSQSINVPINGGATTTVTIMTSSSTPEGNYKLVMHATGNSTDGSYTRTATATINVSETPSALVNPPPTVEASILTIMNATSTYQLMMSSTGALSCTWSRTSSWGGDWSNEAIPATDPPNLTASNISYDSGFVVFPDGDATWEFTCINIDGARASTTVSVSVSSAIPTGTITVSTDHLDGGSSTTIFWQTENTNNCIVKVEGITGGTIVDSWTGIKNNMSGLPTNNLYGNTVYGLMCGSRLLSYVNVVVTINPELKVKPRVAILNGNTVLSWNTHNSNESSCSLKSALNAENLLVGEGDVNKGELEVPVKGRMIYTLSCPNPGGGDPLTDSIMVEVVPMMYES